LSFFFCFYNNHVFIQQLKKSDELNKRKTKKGFGKNVQKEMKKRSTELRSFDKETPTAATVGAVTLIQPIR